MVMIIGILAAILTTLAGLPQLIKLIKTKKSDDLSLTMVLMFVIGILLWLIYGICIVDLPLIIANSFAILIQSTILYFKIKY